MFERGVGQQVAGNLFDREFIEMLVGVEGLDDPVAVRPQRPFVVEMQAVRVAIAGGVQPDAGHVFPIAGGLQQPINHFGIGIRILVGQKRIHFGGSWRQPGQIESHAANERDLVGRLGGNQPLGIQPREDEAVDFVLDPGLVLHNRWGGYCGRDERPMLRPRAAFGDPPLEQFDLGGSHLFPRGGGRHLFVGILRQHAGDQFAFINLARDNGRCSRSQFGGAPFSDVQPQAGLAFLFIGTVALKTIVRQDGPDVAGEVQRPVGGRSRRSGQGQHHHRQTKRDPTQAGRNHRWDLSQAGRIKLALYDLRLGRRQRN